MRRPGVDERFLTVEGQAQQAAAPIVELCVFRLGEGVDLNAQLL
jgi:hypothetical protein